LETLIGTRDVHSGAAAVAVAAAHGFENHRGAVEIFIMPLWQQGGRGSFFSKKLQKFMNLRRMSVFIYVILYGLTYLID
jgi:hypothetical protein